MLCDLNIICDRIWIIYQATISSTVEILVIIGLETIILIFICVYNIL